MTPRSSHVWSPAYAGFLRSWALRGGREGGGTGDDDWCSRDSAGPRRQRPRQEGRGGNRAGQGEAEASSHAPPPRFIRKCIKAEHSVLKNILKIGESHIHLTLQLFLNFYLPTSSLCPVLPLLTCSLFCYFFLRYASTNASWLLF